MSLQCTKRRGVRIFLKTLFFRFRFAADHRIRPTKSSRSSRRHSVHRKLLRSPTSWIVAPPRGSSPIKSTNVSRTMRSSMCGKSTRRAPKSHSFNSFIHSFSFVHHYLHRFLYIFARFFCIICILGWKNKSICCCNLLKFRHLVQNGFKFNLLQNRGRNPHAPRLVLPSVECVAIAVTRSARNSLAAAVAAISDFAKWTVIVADSFFFEFHTFGTCSEKSIYARKSNKFTRQIGHRPSINAVKWSTRHRLLCPHIISFRSPTNFPDFSKK